MNKEAGQKSKATSVCLQITEFDSNRCLHGVSGGVGGYVERRRQRDRHSTLHRRHAATKVTNARQLLLLTTNGNSEQ